MCAIYMCEYIICTEEPTLWLIPKNSQDDRCGILEGEK